MFSFSHFFLFDTCLKLVLFSLLVGLFLPPFFCHAPSLAIHATLLALLVITHGVTCRVSLSLSSDDLSPRWQSLAAVPLRRPASQASPLSPPAINRLSCSLVRRSFGGEHDAQVVKGPPAGVGRGSEGRLQERTDVGLWSGGGRRRRLRTV